MTRHDWLRLLDRFGAAAFGGLVAGFLVGGVGGRAAMFVLRLTSSDGVRGIESDDGFTIGEFSVQTFFLLIATTLVGGILGLLYFLVRRWLPRRGRPALAAAFFAVVGGALVIEPDGVDFTLLAPEWLAVALFVALPAAYGAAYGALMVVVVERRLAGDAGLRKVHAAAAILLVVVGSIGLIPLALTALVLIAFVASRRWPGLQALAEGRVVAWAVRLVLLVLAGLATVALTSDVTEIL
jgi:hypothetical protein